MTRYMKRKAKSLSKPNRKVLENDEVSSSDDEETSKAEKNAAKNMSDQEEGSDEETVQEKRLRLAKEYLDELKKQEKEKAEDAEIDHDAIAHRLKEDFLSKAGRLHRKIAEKLTAPCTSTIKVLRGHKLSPTCVVTSKDNLKCVTGSKDGSLILWDLVKSKKLKTIPASSKKSADQSSVKGHHQGAVFCLALSDDGKFFCSGGADGLVHVWDFETMEPIKDFSGHKGPVTGLIFRQGHHELFSCGHDRSVKIWNLDEMGYVDTMFGHQDSIANIDCLARERAITCGSRDRSIRIWKIVEESQLVFNAHSGCGSIESLSLINEDHFVSGSDDGAISVWSVMKKKPVCLVEKAHYNNETKENCWVSAVCAAKFTDLIASGSCDGFVRFWHCSDNYKNLTLIHSVPIPGFVNYLTFTGDCSKLICAVGQEHKLGRWWRNKAAKNAVYVIELDFL